MEEDRVGQWWWGSPPPLSQGGIPIAVCWYGGQVVADEVVLGVAPRSRGLVPRAEGTEVDGMNPVAPCWYGARRWHRRRGASPSPRGTRCGRHERRRAGDDGGTRGSGLALAGTPYDGTG